MNQHLTEMWKLPKNFKKYLILLLGTFIPIYEAGDYDAVFEKLLGVEITVIHWGVRVLWLCWFCYFVWRGIDGFYGRKDFLFDECD
jgi:hypothetical protein